MKRKGLEEYLDCVDYMIVYQSENLTPTSYTDFDFQPDRESRGTTSGYVFTLGGGSISWSVKQCCITSSTMEAEYVSTCKAGKEVVWLIKLLMDIGLMRIDQSPIMFFYDNSGALAQSKKPRNHKRGQYIERKNHLIREIVSC
jgi:hypothetical protein